MAIRLSNAQRNTVLIFLAIGLIGALGIGGGPAEEANFFQDILVDLGVDRTISDNTNLALIALVGIGITIFMFGNKQVTAS